MTIELGRLLRYDFWANESVQRTLAAASNPPDRATRLYAHIVSVHRLFLSRIMGGDPLPVWPEPGQIDLVRELAAAHQEWRQWLAAANDVTRSISYTNSMGEPWTSRIDDIITHVVIHSAYHRGQIATSLAAEDIDPPHTDYVHCTRNGFI